jgi:hypothetical protein
LEDEAQEAALEASMITGDPPPQKILGVPRFFQDLVALLGLLLVDFPLEVNVQA